ncbi:hypothetical protein K431DRAFT_280173 [Polychaeton citri CBS 116435]|uniref:Uncharacterized protein n=1 Tax=Polychaeton citri CBS 116435 TaxID=1314669 RepID=A0A9P4QF62_9PEZI|nr:hypothetical protein K431DRAFT_280173 [Polychaeton citri CBS 116435]
MLDDNLPTFFLKPATSGIKHHGSLFLSHHGSDPAPHYSLQHADPGSNSPAQRNCYAAALFDAYSQEILYGEVLARPAWTQPTLNQEEIRKNGGVPPPPQPVLNGEFTVQLYGPDQQVRVHLKEGRWGGSDSWTFSMPETSFRTPSASNIDRGTSDPGSLDTTPKVNFVWKKESKLSKDLTCFMTGRSTDKVDKKNKGRKDPDIAVALWRSMRELTIYESNLSRVEMEDPKGLEVVLLLSAIVIKDLYFADKSKLGEVFNITDAAGRKLSSGGRKLSNPKQTNAIYGSPNPLGTLPPNGASPQLTPGPLPPRASTANDTKRNSLPRLQTSPANGRLTAPPAAPQIQQKSQLKAAPPMPDPRQQWDLDAETARLRQEQESEARKLHEQQTQRRREQEKRDEAEAKRLRKTFEAEQRESARKQAEVDKETERLRKLYGVQPVPQRPNMGRPAAAVPPSRRGPGGGGLQPIPQGRIPQRAPNGLYAQPPAASSSALMMSGANDGIGTQQQQAAKKKKSFFGLRSSASDDGGKRLAKKSSTIW